MILTKEKSECEKNASIIVSKDRGNSREHRAINKERKFEVRQYKLDGNLIKQKKSCDYLVINDTSKKAYFIELKGVNLDEAIPQLEGAEAIVKNELRGFDFYYRIIVTKVGTHKIESNAVRKFKIKHSKKLVYRSRQLIENLD